MISVQKTIPDFLVVGATKAATTWLYQCLNEHPEVFVPSLKEVNYFSYHYTQDIQWYLSFFTDVQNEKAIGELSPSYFICDECPKRIYTFNPDIRLLFMLRNPIERAYSQYCMELRYNTVSENLDKELNLESIIVRESLYYQQISKFKKLPFKHLKFIIYDDIQTNPQKVLADIFEFLGVDKSFKNQALFKKHYAQLPRQRFEKAYTYLVALYRWINNNNTIGRNILNSLKKKGLNDEFHRLNSVQKEYPQMSIEKTQELLNFYRQDVEQLSRLIDRDMTFWLSS